MMSSGLMSSDQSTILKGYVLMMSSGLMSSDQSTILKG